MRRLVAFAPWDALQEPIVERTPIKLEQSMPLTEFMDGGNANITLPRGEAGKILVSLLRQSFDRLASEKCLKPYALSERKTAWWVPEGLMAENKAHFTRASGLTGWRKLSGIYGGRERSGTSASTGCRCLAIRITCGSRRTLSTQTPRAKRSRPPSSGGRTVNCGSIRNGGTCSTALCVPGRPKMEGYPAVWRGRSRHPWVVAR